MILEFAKSIRVALHSVLKKTPRSGSPDLIVLKSANHFRKYIVRG